MNAGRCQATRLACYVGGPYHVPGARFIVTRRYLGGTALRMRQRVARTTRDRPLPRDTSRVGVRICPFASRFRSPSSYRYTRPPPFGGGSLLITAPPSPTR